MAAGAVLRRHCRGVLDDLHDLGVNFDVEVVFFGQRLVSVLHSCPDPLSKLSADDRVAHVEDPLQND